MHAQLPPLPVWQRGEPACWLSTGRAWWCEAVTCLAWPLSTRGSPNSRSMGSSSGVAYLTLPAGSLAVRGAPAALAAAVAIAVPRLQQGAGSGGGQKGG